MFLTHSCIAACRRCKACLRRTHLGLGFQTDLAALHVYDLAPKRHVIQVYGVHLVALLGCAAATPVGFAKYPFSLNVALTGLPE
jgi:hypothetical protein